MTSLVTPDGRPPVPQGRQSWSRFSARVPVGFRDEDVHSDVVREAQELVEWVLKGVLRAVGVEPPKFHDVGALLVEHQAKFLPPVREIDCRGQPRSPGACDGSASWPLTAISTSFRRSSTRLTRPVGRMRTRPGSSGWSRDVRVDSGLNTLWAYLSGASCVFPTPESRIPTCFAQIAPILNVF